MGRQKQPSHTFSAKKLFQTLGLEEFDIKCQTMSENESSQVNQHIQISKEYDQHHPSSYQVMHLSIKSNIRQFIIRN